MFTVIFIILVKKQFFFILHTIESRYQFSFVLLDFNFIHLTFVGTFKATATILINTVFMIFQTIYQIVTSTMSAFCYCYEFADKQYAIINGQFNVTAIAPLRQNPNLFISICLFKVQLIKVRTENSLSNFSWCVSNEWLCSKCSKVRKSRKQNIEESTTMKSVWNTLAR